ncbi:MAG: ABC transporter permease [Candidatus Cloacimonadaceae bacterium]|jgi:phospholipid/cholesterol/gamma-HCH transport system permease protein|nr:ABC transporter permease [Candidatus Cloacimonadota bacterium]MDY0127733.1 ABC transporter permease [Candidatus Cloacimonadaceae bacterium]MCB5255424.1 ABC transporter permease [Candidatus Cloacimonadota bacterium]MCK9178721.1 ABC transporter permease [Candidatus Cloacimonadota bacterium]MCK9242561.1 ABC transporter permease [Candidatus Cloacimonadota bacterium]
MTAKPEKKSGSGFFSFVGATLEEALRIRSNRHVSSMVIFRQILFTGYEALPLISFLALAIGGLVILQGTNLLTGFGQGIWVHVILVTVVVNELSGILTALVVVARSGTAISTELGNMKVRREIDLIESFGISPISYLVVSRVIGVVVAMVILVLYFNLVAVLGGWLFSQIFNQLDFRTFMSDFLSVLKISHLVAGFIKSVCFGLIISMVSTYHGMSVRYASTEVPQRTIKAVVISIFAVILSDMLITWLFWILK